MCSPPFGASMPLWVSYLLFVFFYLHAALLSLLHVEVSLLIQVAGQAPLRLPSA